MRKWRLDRATGWSTKCSDCSRVSSELGRPASRARRVMQPAPQSGYAQNSTAAPPSSEYSLTSMTCPSRMRNTFTAFWSKTLPLRSA